MKKYYKYILLILILTIIVFFVGYFLYYKNKISNNPIKEIPGAAEVGKIEIIGKAQTGSQSTTVQTVDSNFKDKLGIK